MLADKNHVKRDTCWGLVELLPELHMERAYEDHELLVENLLMWKVIFCDFNNFDDFVNMMTSDILTTIKNFRLTQKILYGSSKGRKYLTSLQGMYYL